MGWHYRSSARVMPGVRVNIGDPNTASNLYGVRAIKSRSRGAQHQLLLLCANRLEYCFVQERGLQ